MYEDAGSTATVTGPPRQFDLTPEQQGPQLLEPGIERHSADDTAAATKNQDFGTSRRQLYNEATPLSRVGRKGYAVFISFCASDRCSPLAFALDPALPIAPPPACGP
jgi:hypothetical protein